VAELKDLTAISTDPALTDLVYAMLDPSGTPVDRKVAWKYLFGKAMAPVCDGRLTLESGVPVSSTDQTAKTTVYFTPDQGARVAVYDGTRWVFYAFSELSLALGTLTSGANYDVFLYDAAGTLTLTLGPAWTSNTARGTGAGTTELTTQDGVYVNAVSITSGPGAKAGRYLGTLRTTSTTTTEDSAVKRLLWNVARRRRRPVRVTDATNSWTVSTWNYANASAANRVELVVGLSADEALDVSARLLATTAGPARTYTGVGYDSTASPASGCVYASSYDSGGGVTAASTAHLTHVPALGWHYYAWLEHYTGSASTGYGDDGGAVQSGLTGLWVC
jgi:hypothetical protein